MKFSRQQELALIEIGLNTLLNGALNGRKKTPKTKVEEPNAPVEIKKKKVMSPAARRRISRRMKKMWAEKNASQ
jgi:hypothetical protein